MNLFEFAQQVEDDGRRVFRRLARTSGHPGVKRIFHWVARDEEALARKLVALREQNRAHLKEESAVLEELAGEFRELATRTGQAVADSDVAALDLAARYEEGVCRLFGEAAELESDQQAGALLRQVRDLECREARELRSTFDFVNAPNEYLAWGEFSNLEEFHNFGRDVD